MHISATFLKDERKSGTFEGTPYDFTLLHLLDDSTVRKVRLPRDVHTHPFSRGDEVEIDVEVADNVKITTSQDAYAQAVAGLRANLSAAN